MKRTGLLISAACVGACTFLLALLLASILVSGGPVRSGGESKLWWVLVLVGGGVSLCTMLAWLQWRVIHPLEKLGKRLPPMRVGEDAGKPGAGRFFRIGGITSRFSHFLSHLAENARADKANYLALELAFSQLHAVLNSIWEGVLVADRSGELVMANPTARKILRLGYDKEWAEGIVDLFPPGKRRRIRAAMDEAVGSGETQQIENLEIGNRIYKVSLAPIRDSLGSETELPPGVTEDWGVALVLVDITEAHEISRMKDDFLSSISHELRTPLTSIRSFSEILLTMTPEDEKTWGEFLGIVNSEAERLTRLVNDLLDLSQIEAGKMKFHCEPLTLERQIRNTVALFSQLRKEKEVEIQLELDPHLPNVRGDRDRLHQVLTNLFANALKFVPDRGTVRVRVQRKGEMVEVSVEDDGTGVPEEKWKTVFEKFRQVGETMTDKPTGTGLGLAICKKILDQLDGEIWCEKSEDLGGARFAFTLPVSYEGAEQF